MNKKNMRNCCWMPLTSFILWMTLSYISWLQCALLCDQRGFLSCSLHCVWKSHRKVSFNIAREASYVYIHFKWTKLHQKCKKGPFRRGFENLNLRVNKQVTVFENHRKSLIQHCEGSELRLHFEWPKVDQNAKNRQFWWGFETGNLRLNSVTRQINFKGKNW